MLRSWFLSLVLLAGLGAARTADAADLAGAHITVSAEPGAEDCPDADGLAQRVRSLWMAPETNPAPLRISLHFVRAPNGYSAELQSFGRKTGTRHLSTTATSCASLSDAATVALALLLDMEPILRVEPSRPPEVSARTAASSHKPPERAGAPFELALLAKAGAGFSLLGNAVSGVFSASLLVRRGPFATEGQAFWSTPRDFAHGPGFVKVGLWGGGLDACYQGSSLARSLRLRPCAGVRLGKLSGEGERFDANYTSAQAWVALAASLNLELQLRPYARFVLGFSLLAPLHEHKFHVDGSGPAYQSRVLAGLAQVGTEFAIW
jgi:hypothetical protein